MVGKEITFSVSHTLVSSDGVSRDFGVAYLSGIDIATELLKNGWVKVKEHKGEPTPEHAKRKDIESEAKASGKGLWNLQGPPVRPCHVHFSYDAQKFRLILSSIRCLQMPMHFYQNGRASPWMVNFLLHLHSDQPLMVP